MLQGLDELGLAARDRQGAMLREVAMQRRTDALPAPPLRERVAAALIALAVWLAPAAWDGRPAARAART